MERRSKSRGELLAAPTRDAEVPNMIRPYTTKLCKSGSDSG